jgi:uncharacterized cupin superfamily protein
MASPTVDRRLGLVGNVAIKAPVTVVATSNISLSGEQTIDGVAVLASNANGVADRVLCQAQTNASENGIWDVSTGNWTRSKDADGNNDIVQGTLVQVTRGSTNNAGTFWTLATSGAISIGTTALSWARSLVSSLSSLIFTQSGTGAVARTAQDKMREVPVSPEDFGAVGDGVTDDTAAMRKAFARGGRIRIQGDYLLTEKVVATKEGTFLEGPAAAWGSEVPTHGRFIAAPALSSDYLIEFKNPDREAMRSVGARNIGIDCGTSSCGGIAFRAPYDASTISNISVINVPGDKVGFACTEYSDATARTGIPESVMIDNVWALKRTGVNCSVAPFLLSAAQECTLSNIKGSNGDNTCDPNVPGIQIDGCYGVTLITPAAVNKNGYGILLRQNMDVCNGVAIINPTYEKCKQPFGVINTDTRMFGAAPMTVVAQGSMIKQPADGSGATGMVWQSTVNGIYVKNTTGTFVLGNVYDGSGNVVSNITSFDSVNSTNITHLNPRTLSVNLSGAAASDFKYLQRSVIDLPMDTQASPVHTYTVDSTVSNCEFREMQYGAATNNSATSRVTSVGGEISLLYPDVWPLTGTAVDLAAYSTQRRLRISKDGGGALAITIAGSGITIGKYGVTTLTMYSGALILERASTSKWEVVSLRGNVRDATAGMIASSPQVTNVTATTSFDATAHDTTYTNVGAAVPVAINGGIAGSACPIGTRVTLTKVANQNFYFQPDAGDTIVGASAAGKYVIITAVGTSITLEVIAANTWAVVASSGAYTFQP